MSKNIMCQHLSNADTNFESFPDSDTVHKSPVREQYLPCSENLNSNISNKSFKMSNCTSKSPSIIIKEISRDNVKKTFTVLEKVRSTFGTNKQSYENKRKSLPPAMKQFHHILLKELIPLILL